MIENREKSKQVMVFDSEDVRGSREWRSVTDELQHESFVYIVSRLEDTNVITIVISGEF